MSGIFTPFVYWIDNAGLELLCIAFDTSTGGCVSQFVKGEQNKKKKNKNK